MAGSNSANREKTRRTAIKLMGTAAAAASSIPLVSAKRSEENTKKKVFNSANQKYPTEEAEFFADRWKMYFESVEKGKISKEEAHSDLTNDLLENTTKMSSSIREYISFKDKSQTENNGVVHSNSEYDTNATAAGSWTYLSLNGFTEKKTGGISVNDTRFLTKGMEEAISYFYGYASGFAEVQLGGGYKPSVGGSHDINIRYFRKGAVSNNGSANIWLFAQELNDKSVEYRKKLDSGQTSGGYDTQTAQFNLRKEVPYKIGIRLRTEVDGFEEYIYSDYYSGDREVRTDYIRVRY